MSSYFNFLQSENFVFSVSDLKRISSVCYT